MEPGPRKVAPVFSCPAHGRGGRRTRRGGLPVPALRQAIPAAFQPGAGREWSALTVMSRSQPGATARACTKQARPPPDRYTSWPGRGGDMDLIKTPRRPLRCHALGTDPWPSIEAMPAAGRFTSRFCIWTRLSIFMRQAAFPSWLCWKTPCQGLLSRERKGGTHAVHVIHAELRARRAWP